MARGGKLPDAWDDDWVDKADASYKSPTISEPSPKPARLSKAERRARQAEFNRQLWEDAEKPADNFFLNTRADVPLKTEFKPAVKVLSRKPTANVAAGPEDAPGLSQLNAEDDDDEEDEGQKTSITHQERQLKAQREREEKKRKYEEARQRLFGSDASASKPSYHSSNPKVNGDVKAQLRNKGGRDARPISSGSGSTRQLYDPSYATMPDSSSFQKERTPTSSGRSTPNHQQPIRTPRGPDATGRGGFGFAPRGNRVG